jgi:hypothetical protein
MYALTCTYIHEGVHWYLNGYEHWISLCIQTCIHWYVALCFKHRRKQRFEHTIVTYKSYVKMYRLGRNSDFSTWWTKRSLSRCEYLALLYLFMLRVHALSCWKNGSAAWAKPPNNSKDVWVHNVWDVYLATTWNKFKVRLICALVINNGQCCTAIACRSRQGTLHRHWRP